VPTASVTSGREPPGVPAEDRSRSRSLIASRDGIVASESALASQVGARILERGGHAVEAAVAANAVLGVLAPMNCGIGGDLFALVHEAGSGQLCGLNASGWAPAALTPGFLRARGIGQMPESGIHSVTVPGTVAGWSCLLRRFGTRDFAELLAPAIACAEGGFVVDELVQAYWQASAAALRADPVAVALYLPDGRAPEAGALYRNPELAWSYRQIARDGAAAFYLGPIAQRILTTSRRWGGSMEEQDLALFAAEWVDPVTTTYRGWRVSELPPNGQGIAALEMIGIMERFALRECGHNSARALHILIEAKKLAYADLLRYVADPRAVGVPVATLCSKEFAAARAALIEPERAARFRAPAALAGTDNGTTYLAVVDRAGNMVSLIQSNFASIGFGAGLAVGGAGFALQNRGALFTLEATHPNVLAGRKRPLHTILPAFMQARQRRIAFGIMGGWNQAQAHAQFVANVVDFGMNIQAALDAPRFSKHSFEGCDVSLEARIPVPVREQLAAWGHEIELRGDFSSLRMGAGQAVERDDARGVNFGASDPRKDGAAIAELRLGEF
jgi:gamma-glutamyltranspeptidase/glutathione hydrolase